MIETLIESIRARLWPTQLPASKVSRGLLVVARFVFALGRDLLSGELNLRAMSLVYTTMIAVVPLLAFSFSVLKGLGFHRQLEPLIAQFLAPLGPKGIEITSNVIGFVDNVRSTALAGVSLGILLFTVLSMAQKVEDSFNFVWRVDRPRSLARRFSEYLSVMLVGPVLMTFALGITASISSTAVVQKLQEIEPFGSGMLLLGKLSPYLLVIAAFTFLYAFVPNTRVRLRAASLAGTVAGAMWAAGGSLFAQFVVAASRTEAIYSGFAIVIVAMIWLYLSWLILLIGAQLGFYLQNRDYLPIGRRTPHMSTGLTEKLALMTMMLVAEDFFLGGHGWRVESLAGRANLPAHQLEPIVESLRRNGLLTETVEQRLAPARDLSQISVQQILAAIRETDGQHDYGWPSAVTTLSDSMETALHAAVEGQSLETLVQAQQSLASGSD
jgi:membrane protein